MKQNFEPIKKNKLKVKFVEDEISSRKEKQNKPKRKCHDIPLRDHMACNWTD